MLARSVIGRNLFANRLGMIRPVNKFAANDDQGQSCRHIKFYPIVERVIPAKVVTLQFPFNHQSGSRPCIIKMRGNDEQIHSESYQKNAVR